MCILKLAKLQLFVVFRLLGVRFVKVLNNTVATKFKHRKFLNEPFQFTLKVLVNIQRKLRAVSNRETFSVAK